jgi:SHS2 domain-containing protein
MRDNDIRSTARRADVTAFELVGNGLRATVTGRRDRPRHLVKAATLNSLELGEHEGKWHGRVVLDV